MTTNAMKAWGTTATFNGNLIGEITSLGGSDRVREIIEVFTCDSANEAVEKISSGIDEGTVDLGFIFDGKTAGTYYNLDTDYAAGTSATLLLTMKNGSTLSMTAIIAALGKPAFGNPKGAVVDTKVSFSVSGAITYTPHV